MSRNLTSRSTLENLKREAKRWLQLLRAGDADARARFERSHPQPPAQPGLRDVQHALAREHGFPGWTALKEELARRTASATPRAGAVQELLAAAERGDAERVREVLDAQRDIVNERAELHGHTGKRSALHFAMNSMNEEVVDLLLARGADPNLRDDGDHAMPLHFAAERGRLDIVRKLIEHGADPIGADDYHELEVIGWATCFGFYHPEVAHYLLEHGARHTIFSAVAMGDTAALREVAARSPDDLNRRMDDTNHRRRPLHLAIIKQQPAALRTLLELGADPNATDVAGLTALDQAALSGETELARLLLDHGARLELPAAVALDLRADIDRLLGEDPDYLRPGGRWETLIVRAAERAGGPVMEALIRAGASVHIHDDSRTSVDGTHGYTPLHAAAANGNLDAIRVLLAHGANPGAREDRYVSTPAGWASYFNHTAARDLILEGPIDIFDAIAFDRADRIAEILARDPAALERTFQQYTSGRVDLTEPDWTPLAYAAANDKPDAMSILLEHGADPDRRTNGLTAAEIAAQRSGTP